MIKKYLKIIFSTLLTFTFLFPLTCFADNEVSVSFNPRNPTPFTSITLTAVSYLINVNTAFISWSINGKEVDSGLGHKNLTIKTGEAGSVLQIHAVIKTASGDIYELDVNVIPESVDIIYETPESYTPPFYEGRSLPGEGATINFVALPNISENGEKIPPSSLSYFWYVSGEFVDNLSGINKQSALIDLDFLRSFTTVRVVVKGPSGTTAEKSVDVYPHEIMPLFYSYDEVLGADYTKLISRRFETTKDFTVVLEPFFLSMKGQLEDSPTFVWTLNDSNITPLGGRTLSMHPKENSYGSKNLSINIGNTTRRLQKAVANLNIIFDTRQ